MEITRPAILADRTYNLYFIRATVQLPLQSSLVLSTQRVSRTLPLDARQQTCAAVLRLLSRKFLNSSRLTSDPSPQAKRSATSLQFLPTGTVPSVSLLLRQWRRLEPRVSSPSRRARCVSEGSLTFLRTRLTQCAF